MKLIIDLENRTMTGSCKAGEFKEQMKKLKEVLDDGRKKD